MDQALKSLLAWWDTAGVDIPNVPVLPKAVLPKDTFTSSSKNKTIQQSGKPPSDILQIAESIAATAKTLEDLKSALEKFDAGALSDGAHQCVFARGNPEANIMIIGEAPGREEDLAGQPFVGRSGQLLDRMLASVGLTQTDYYITNVINWRPPKNRNPKIEEIALCRPFLNRHIELMAPKIIVIVGGISLSALTGVTGIMKNRGQWQTLTINGLNIPALPLYHPAFLLRQPALKKEAWRDLLTLKAKVDSL